MSGLTSSQYTEPVRHTHSRQVGRSATQSQHTDIRPEIIGLMQAGWESLDRYRSLSYLKRLLPQGSGCHQAHQQEAGPAAGEHMACSFTHQQNKGGVTPGHSTTSSPALTSIGGQALTLLGRQKGNTTPGSIWSKSTVIPPSPLNHLPPTTQSTERNTDYNGFNISWLFFSQYS